MELPVAKALPDARWLEGCEQPSAISYYAQTRTRNTAKEVFAIVGYNSTGPPTRPTCVGSGRKRQPVHIGG
jgi:hypothetical protein